MRALVVLPAVVLGLGCPGEPPPPGAVPPTATTPAATAAPTASTAKRPPHPNMASATWGEQVALALSKDVVIEHGADARALLGEALVALHGLEPGGEQRALDRALRAWKSAPDDATRGTALAVAALAMVLEPTVEGYRERLVDAFGLAAYAGTVDASDSVGQCARAVVGAAGGAVRQARALIDLVARTPGIADDTHGLLALARDGVRDRSDAFFDDLALGEKARQSSVRLLALHAERLQELGLLDEADALLADRGEPPLVLARGRGLVLRRTPEKAAEARALLAPLAETLAGVDEPRRSEALAWLALAGATGPEDGVQAARGALALLSARPGWSREAALVQSVLDVRSGARETARARLVPLLQGTPTSPVVIERLIAETALTLCAEARDVACVERGARRMAVIDVDDGLVLRMRGIARRTAGDEAAAPPTDAGSPAGAPGPTPAEMMQEAARYDAMDRAAGLAVRRAIASGAPRQAAATLERLLKNPADRVARALAVAVAPDAAQQARRAAAAVLGEGPPLAEDDLVAVIDALGGARTKEGEGALRLLAADPRPRVVAAVERARADLKDPESRRKRKAAEHGGHDSDIPGAPAP